MLCWFVCQSVPLRGRWPARHLPGPLIIKGQKQTTAAVIPDLMTRVILFKSIQMTPAVTGGNTRQKTEVIKAYARGPQPSLAQRGKHQNPDASTGKLSPGKQMPHVRGRHNPRWHHSRLSMGPMPRMQKGVHCKPGKYVHCGSGD